MNVVNAALKVDVIDRVIFSRWLRPPTKQDLEIMENHMALAHKRLGQNLLYVGSIDSKVKVPNAEERNNLNALMNAARKYCEVAYVIIEGSDLQNSLQRVIISGMLIVTRTYDDFLSVHKSIDSVAPDLSKRLNKDASPLVRVARDRSLVL